MGQGGEANQGHRLLARAADMQDEEHHADQETNLSLDHNVATEVDLLPCLVSDCLQAAGHLRTPDRQILEG